MKLILTISSLLLTVWMYQHLDPCSVILSLSTTYAMLILIDCTVQLRQLRATIIAGAFGPGLQLSEESWLTTPGRYTQSLANSILFCLNRFQDSLFREHLCAVHSRTPKMSEALPASILADVPADTKWLSRACNAFSASGVAVVQINDRGRKLQVAATSGSSRYAAAIECFVSSLLESQRRLVGLYECEAANPAARAIALFGVAYMLLLPLPASAGSECVCCLAFDQNCLLDAYQCESMRQELLQMYREHQQLGLQRRIASAQEAEQATRQFVGHLSHDIRAPLHNVKAALRLISLSGEDAEMQAVALRNCEALEDIIGGILDLTRHSAGQLQSRMVALSVNQLITDICKDFEFSATERNLQLSSRLPNSDAQITADPVQLRRVLTNLISNALAYTETGSIELEVHITADNMVVISVQDSGRGMTAAEVAQMFEPFCRFTADAGGTGLGLAICKILAEANNGTIHATSSPGAGTTVTLRFVRLIQDAVPLDSVSSVSVVKKIASDDVDGPVVLLVDDDPDAVAALERALVTYAIRVCSAVGVAEARAICTYALPDLIVTDDAMPGGGGAALIDFLEQRGDSVPVFVLSGSEFSLRREMYPAVWAENWFLKPVDPHIFAGRIAQCLSDGAALPRRKLASVA